jgi:hypothetical protein
MLENIINPIAMGRTPVGSTCASDGRVRKDSDARGFMGAYDISAACLNEAVAIMNNGACTAKGRTIVGVGEQR